MGRIRVYKKAILINFAYFGTSFITQISRPRALSVPSQKFALTPFLVIKIKVKVVFNKIHPYVSLQGNPSIFQIHLRHLHGSHVCTADGKELK
jgi:hypothetical protein